MQQFMKFFVFTKTYPVNFQLFKLLSKLILLCL